MILCPLHSPPPIRCRATSMYKTHHKILLFIPRRKKSHSIRRDSHTINITYSIMNYGVDEWQCKRRYHCSKRLRERRTREGKVEKIRKNMKLNKKTNNVSLHRMIPKQRLPSIDAVQEEDYWDATFKKGRFFILICFPSKLNMWSSSENMSTTLISKKKISIKKKEEKEEKELSLLHLRLASARSLFHSR